MEQEERVKSLREVLTSGLSGGEGSPSAFLGSYADPEHRADPEIPSLLAKAGKDVGMRLIEILLGPPSRVGEALVEGKDVSLEDIQGATMLGIGVGYKGAPVPTPGTVDLGMLKVHGVGKSLALTSKYGGPDRMSLFKEGMLVPQKDWTNIKDIVQNRVKFTGRPGGASYTGSPVNIIDIGTESGRKGIFAHEFGHERFEFPTDAMEAAVVNRLLPVSNKIFEAKIAGKLEGGFSGMDYWNLSPEEQTAMAMARKMVFAIEKNQPFNFDRAFMESAREGQSKALNFMEGYVRGDFGGKMPEPNYSAVSEALREYKKILGVKDRHVSYSIGKGETP